MSTLWATLKVMILDNFAGNKTTNAEHRPTFDALDSRLEKFYDEATAAMSQHDEATAKQAAFTDFCSSQEDLNKNDALTALILIVYRATELVRQVKDKDDVGIAWANGREDLERKALELGARLHIKLLDDEAWQAFRSELGCPSKPAAHKKKRSATAANMPAEGCSGKTRSAKAKLAKK